MGRAAPSDDSPFRWYLLGAGSWFAAFGIQAVMFAYLVTTVLHAPADQIGLAQASLTIVSTILLLLGGAVADHVDTRRLLIFGHLAAAVPAAALAAIVAFGYLRFEWLIVYGLFMGLITAFTMPAREAMMGDVIGVKGVPAIQRAVTTTVGTTMVGQILGMLTAGLAAVAGAAPIILLQVVSQLVGAFASAQLAPSTRHAEHANTDGHMTRIAGGLREVTKSHALLPITILTLAIGVLFIGAFLVILPVILRNEFGGEVQQFAATQVAFWGGSIVSSLTISRLGNVVNRGRLVVIAMTLGITVLTAMSFKGSLITLYALVFLWGIGAGITISMSRTIVQEHAPPAHRARVLSVYQLGFTGGMSIGAFLIGFIVEMIGARQATLVPAGIMALVLTTLVTTTKLWHIRAVGHEASVPA